MSHIQQMISDHTLKTHSWLLFNVPVCLTTTCKQVTEHNNVLRFLF